MAGDFIDELRNAFDKGAVLSGDDIDARYHHDPAGLPVSKPRALVWSAMICMPGLRSARMRRA